MKKKALAVLLTASVIAGTMGGTATIVHADEEGKVINIYSWNKGDTFYIICIFKIPTFKIIFIRI